MYSNSVCLLLCLCAFLRTLLILCISAEKHTRPWYLCWRVGYIWNSILLVPWSPDWNSAGVLVICGRVHCGCSNHQLCDALQSGTHLQSTHIWPYWVVRTIDCFSDGLLLYADVGVFCVYLCSGCTVASFATKVHYPSYCDLQVGCPDK